MKTFAFIAPMYNTRAHLWAKDMGQTLIIGDLICSSSSLAWVFTKAWVPIVVIHIN